MYVYIQEVCYQYWPSSGTQTYGEFTVELVGVETMDGHVVKTITTTHSEVCIIANVMILTMFVVPSLVIHIK